MAGIEKVCEFSGDYRGYEMYTAKRNQLQILPEYRKVFRKAEHILHVFVPTKVWFDGTGSWDYDPEEMQHYEPAFKSEQEYITYIEWRRKARLVNDYTFALQVFSPSLKGKVEGIYMNWTKDLSTTKRKLKRLLRAKRVNIVYHQCTYWGWKETLDTTL